VYHKHSNHSIKERTSVVLSYSSLSPMRHGLGSGSFMILYRQVAMTIKSSQSLVLEWQTRCSNHSELPNKQSMTKDANHSPSSISQPNNHFSQETEIAKNKTCSHFEYLHKPPKSIQTSTCWKEREFSTLVISDQGLVLIQRRLYASLAYIVPKKPSTRWKKQEKGKEELRWLDAEYFAFFSNRSSCRSCHRMLLERMTRC